MIYHDIDSKARAYVVETELSCYAIDEFAYEYTFGRRSLDIARFIEANFILYSSVFMEMA